MDCLQSRDREGAVARGSNSLVLAFLWIDRPGLTILQTGAGAVRGMLWLHGYAPEAERELRQAGRELPQDAAIHINPGNALQMPGGFAEYKIALQLDSGLSRAELLNDLGVNPSLSSAQANLAKALHAAN